MVENAQLTKRKNQKKQIELAEQAENRKKQFWSRPIVWLSSIFVCILLWGSAFPAVKTGYELLQINTKAPNAIASLLLFAGIRFFLAGLITITFTALTEKINPFPKNKNQWLDAFKLSIPQTVFLYGLYFVGLAHTTGAAGSIMSSTSSFIAVIMASLVFADEKMNIYKIIGSIIGFSGVVILNLKSGSSLGFNWLGDGLMLLSAFATAAGIVLSKPLAKRNHPRLLSGWNFVLGGMILIVIGVSLGGKLNPINFTAWILLFYLGCLSSVAFGLWTTMVKYHSVSKLSVFKSLIPVVGTVGSGIVLKENIFQLRLLLALALVVAGIVIVNYNKPIKLGSVNKD